MDPKLIGRLSDMSMWMRIILSLVFICVNYFAQQLITLTGIIQTLWALVCGHPNENITAFAKSLTKYAYHMTRYYNLLEDEKPFPFSSWPSE